MRTIEITYERTQRIFKSFDVTDEEFKQLMLGDNPFTQELIDELDAGNGVEEDDYTVTDEYGRTLVDWN